MSSFPWPGPRADGEAGQELGAFLSHIIHDPAQQNGIVHLSQSYRNVPGFHIIWGREALLLDRAAHPHIPVQTPSLPGLQQPES